MAWYLKKIILVILLVSAPLPVYGQGVSMELWDNAALTNHQDLANTPDLLGPPTFSGIQTSFNGPINTPGNFVARYMGKIVPPTTGIYYFWIAASQKGTLWISPDTPNFSGRTPLAKVSLTQCATPPCSPPSPQQWTKYQEQRSAQMSLTGGRTYYLLMIQVETDGDGLNHAAVGWQMPPSECPNDATACYERPIPGSRAVPTAYPMVMNLTTDRSIIDHSQPLEEATLTWTATNASSCDGTSTPAYSAWNGFKSTIGGSLAVYPNLDTTFFLTCVPLDGSGYRVFSLTIQNAYVKKAGLTWAPIPRLYVDGSPIPSELTIGYRIYYGTYPGLYNQPFGSGLDVGNGTDTTLINFPSSNGTPVTYYFVLTAFIRETGAESAYSNEVFKTLYIP